MEDNLKALKRPADDNFSEDEEVEEKPKSELIVPYRGRIGRQKLTDEDRKFFRHCRIATEDM